MDDVGAERFTASFDRGLGEELSRSRRRRSHCLSSGQPIALVFSDGAGSTAAEKRLAVGGDHQFLDPTSRRKGANLTLVRDVPNGELDVAEWVRSMKPNLKMLLTSGYSDMPHAVSAWTPLSLTNR